MVKRLLYIFYTTGGMSPDSPVHEQEVRSCLLKAHSKERETGAFVSLPLLKKQFDNTHKRPKRITIFCNVHRNDVVYHLCTYLYAIFPSHFRNTTLESVVPKNCGIHKNQKQRYRIIKLSWELLLSCSISSHMLYKL